MDELTAALKIQEIDGGVVLGVKVAPGSSKTAITGTLGGMLKIKIAAAAEKGKANRCLLEFLSKQLGVKKKEDVLDGVEMECVSTMIMGNYVLMT